MTTASIVQRVWNYCHTLRDDGVSYGYYLEQLTYLLFLKMADEYSKPPYNRKINIPKNLNWESLLNKSGAELEVHYVKILTELCKEKGMIGEIFFKSKNEIQDPEKHIQHFKSFGCYGKLVLKKEYYSLQTETFLLKTPIQPYASIGVEKL